MRGWLWRRYAERISQSQVLCPVWLLFIRCSCSSISIASASAWPCGLRPTRLLSVGSSRQGHRSRSPCPPPGPFLWHSSKDKALRPEEILMISSSLGESFDYKMNNIKRKILEVMESVLYTDCAHVYTNLCKLIITARRQQQKFNLTACSHVYVG